MSESTTTMATSPTLTNAEMEKAIKASTYGSTGLEDVARDIIVIGCGDGGCNIASRIRDVLKDSYVIAYNTSPRAMEAIGADIKILPSQEDGTGKDRAYSQEVFKMGSYKDLLTSVKKLADGMKHLEYIVVTTTCDGGTGGGVSPMVAKYINDNVNVPVIIVGVYPTLNEDATAQYNTMRWQQEVNKTGIPHIIFDNDMVNELNKIDVHNRINDAIASAMGIMTGTPFGKSNISMIDNRDMYMLLKHLGGRIAIYGSPDRPTAGQTIDDYLIELVNSWPEPAPKRVSGIGLFLKGPEDFIKRADTSLSKFLQVHNGVAAAKYVHVEESNDVYIGLICSRCSEATERIYLMRQKYDESMKAMQFQSSTVDDILSGIETSPMGVVSHATVQKNNTEPDLSALGF